MTSATRAGETHKSTPVELDSENWAHASHINTDAGTFHWNLCTVVPWTCGTMNKTWKKVLKSKVYDNGPSWWGIVCINIPLNTRIGYLDWDAAKGSSDNSGDCERAVVLQSVWSIRTDELRVVHLGEGRSYKLQSLATRANRDSYQMQCAMLRTPWCV